MSAIPSQGSAVSTRRRWAGRCSWRSVNHSKILFLGEKGTLVIMKRATFINSNIGLVLLAALSGCGGGDNGTNDNVNAIQIGALTDETTTSLDYMKAMSLAVSQMNGALAQAG